MQYHAVPGEYLTVYGISDGLYTYETTEDTTVTTPDMCDVNGEYPMTNVEQ